MKIPKLLEMILETVHPGSRILELGAGAGKTSLLFADRGAEVFALDRQGPSLDVHGSNIHWITANLAIFPLKELPSELSLIYSKNLIQFLDKEYVLKTLIPSLLTHLAPGGLLAVATFSAPPEPPFESLRPMSFYTWPDFIELTSGTEKVYTQEVTAEGPDMAGTLRIFHRTEFIVKKIK